MCCSNKKIKLGIAESELKWSDEKDWRGQNTKASCYWKMEEHADFHTAGIRWLCPLSSSHTFDMLPLFSFCTFAHKIWYIQSTLPDIWLEKQSIGTYQLIQHTRLALCLKTLTHDFLRDPFFPRGFVQINLYFKKFVTGSVSLSSLKKQRICGALGRSLKPPPLLLCFTNFKAQIY